MTENWEVDDTRAIITEKEREDLTGANGEDKKWQATSRVRRRIEDELTTDVSLLEKHHPDLLTELEDVACSSNGQAGVVQQIAERLLQTGEGETILDNLPDEGDLAQKYDRLLYSSTLVDQSYMALFGRHIPQNVSERYAAAAVLQQRELGVGVVPFEQSKSAEKGEKIKEGIGDNDVQTVFRVTGDLKIKPQPDDEVGSETKDSFSDMFVNEVQSDEMTFTDFGSAENYHPLVRQQVNSGKTFDAGSVVGFFIQFSQESTTEGTVHFMQLALNP